jgi:Cu-Zn family superoxide dismutase
MTRLALALLTGIATLTGACAHQGGDVAGVTKSDTATAELHDAAGAAKAHAQVSQEKDALRVKVQAEQMTPGTYGIHLHAVGRCDAPEFKAAGPHWNPTLRKHGKDNPEGMHQGDLPNLVIGADGTGTIDFVIGNASMAALLDADGAAVVLHAGPDDYHTDPAGNSGARIACGVLTRS